MNNIAVISNFIWRFLERCGAQLAGFIVYVVIARILSPEAYGTVALITVVTAILQVFVDSSFGNALIQKKDADDLDFSSVFFANIAICFVLYVGLYFAAPFIADFYKNAELTPYIRVLGITVLVSGLKNVQQAYVSRNMMFKKFFFSTLGGTVAAGAAGIIMALNGFGVWALVVQQVTNLSIDTVILWITVKWRPKKMFSFSRLKGLFGYGWKLLASALIDAGYRELRSLIIGKLYSSADLAYYNKGQKFPDLIVTNINTSIDSVLLPVMSDAQENRKHIKKMTGKSILISTYIMAPLMIGLFVLAEPVVRLLLTEKWLPCVLFLRFFCISYMFYPINTANLNAIKALGRSDIFLKLEIVKKIIGLILLLSTMFISVEAMAYSLLVSMILSQMINAFPNKKLLGYSYPEQLKDILPSILLAVFMGLCVYPIVFIGLSDILTIIIQVILGAAIYIGGSRILKLKAFYYFCGILKSFISRKKGSRK